MAFCAYPSPFCVLFSQGFIVELILYAAKDPFVIVVKVTVEHGVIAYF